MTLSPNSVFMLVSIFCVAIFVLVTLLWLFGPAPKNAEYNKADESKTMSIEEIMKILDNPKLLKKIDIILLCVYNKTEYCQR